MREEVQDEVAEDQACGGADDARDVKEAESSIDKARSIEAWRLIMDSVCSVCTADRFQP